MVVKFMVLGDPKGKQRPKFSRQGKFVRAYTPKQTVKYEEKVKTEYINQVDQRLQGPIGAKITSYFQIPKSVSRKKRQKMIGEYHTNKPDTDNIGKIILDPLNDVAFDDDKQVCQLTVEKYYGETPGVIVELRELIKRPGEKDLICPLHFHDVNGHEIDEILRRSNQ